MCSPGKEPKGRFCKVRAELVGQLDQALIDLFFLFVHLEQMATG